VLLDSGLPKMEEGDAMSAEMCIAIFAGLTMAEWLVATDDVAGPWLKFVSTVFCSASFGGLAYSVAIFAKELTR